MQLFWAGPQRNSPSPIANADWRKNKSHCNQHILYNSLKNIWNVYKLRGFRPSGALSPWKNCPPSGFFFTSRRIECLQIPKFLSLSCFQTHFTRRNVTRKRSADEDVTAKINTLMVPFCFEIWIYYKWVPDKQTHGWLPPSDVLGGSRSLHRNNATANHQRE